MTSKNTPKVPKYTDIANTLFPQVSESLLVDVLFHSIGDGAIATDEFGNITHANSVALHILGYKEREIIGKWFPSKVIAITEDDTKVPYIDQSITRAFLTGRSVSDKTYYLHKAGYKIPVSITVSPIIYKRRPIGAINLFRDITEEFEIDRMKSEFISLASHQLRTPLSAIKTYSHMLMEGYMGKLSQEQAEALHTIVDSADKMNQLTNTLLNVTRIESGFITISKNPLNLAEVLQKIVRDQQISAFEKNINLSLHLPASLPKIISDPFITEEILANLLSNAIKYTPEKGCVEIKAIKYGDQVICSVSDTGIGIPKSSQRQIFSKFYRASNVVARDTNGNGLGLYLVKEMANRLGAEVWFESELGKGSTFYASFTSYSPRSFKRKK